MSSIPHHGTPALALAELGMPIVCGRLTLDGNPDNRDYRWKGWQKAAPGSRSARAVSAWKKGEALAGVTGVVYDVIDIDPRNGGKESFLSPLGNRGPEIYWKIRTPRGGVHLYIACLGIGSHNGFLPGVDLKGGKEDGSGRGFVFLPPTTRFGKEYSVAPGFPRSAPGRACSALRKLILDTLDSGVTDARPEEEALRIAVLKAEAGEQRLSLLRYVHELERRGLDSFAIISVMRDLLGSVSNFDPRNPWYPARGRDPERWIKSLLHRPGVVIGDADPSELEGVASARPSFKDPSSDFWDSRPVLAHILSWARARRTSPWAVFGEALAQAICHCSPSFFLPALVGGRGTLNMLIAITGRAGGGKSASRSAARDAFAWAGNRMDIPDRIPVFPLGSGEGLVKNFGFSVRDADGKWGLCRTEYSCIVSIAEIDTFAALSGRSGSTISTQLRQLYSGEDLGFGYADIGKRVIIPEGEYRAVVIAGVQPGRGAVILDDIESGFAQRWLWLPASDPGAPEEWSGDPPVLSWEPPGVVKDLDVDSSAVMSVCDRAVAEIDAARLVVLRGGGSDMDAHRMYTRLKVAAGLALLSGSDSVSVADWELSAVVQSVSDTCREEVRSRLSEVARAAVMSAGRAEGVRSAVAREAATGFVVGRIATSVLRHIPRDGWISSGKLLSKIAARDREEVGSALSMLVSEGKILMEEVTYRGRSGVQYRRI